MDLKPGTGLEYIKYIQQNEFDCEMETHRVLVLWYVLPTKSMPELFVLMPKVKWIWKVLKFIQQHRLGFEMYLYFMS